MQYVHHIFILLMPAFALIVIHPEQAFSQQYSGRDYELSIARGELALASEDLAAARDHFRRALQAKPGDRNATLYLASALSRGGDHATARDVLEQALAADPADPRLHYELGVVLAGLGRKEEADAHFAAAAASPDLAPRGGDAAGSRMNLSLSGGIQYDSNVLLEPDAPVAAREQKDDLRVVLNFAGSYAFVRSGGSEATLGYRLYQSLHAELEDFNVQQHDLHVAGRFRYSSAGSIGMRYHVLFSTVSADHYSTVYRFQLDLARSFSPRSLTELRLGSDGKRYVAGPDFPANPERNATNSSLGLGHTILLTRDTAAAVDYTYDTDSADLSRWDSTAHKGSVYLRFKRPWAALLLSGSFCDRKYGEDPSAPLLPKRHDQVQEYGVTLRRDIGAGAFISLSGSFIVNDSNKAEYEYKRNIIGLTAEVAL